MKMNVSYKAVANKSMAIAALVLAFSAFGVTSKVHANEISGAGLASGHCMYVGDYLGNGDLGSNGHASRLIMQNDGNLVLYKMNAQGQTAGSLWSSGTAGTGLNNRACLQADGNFVVYTSANKAVWNTHTNGLLNQDSGMVYLSGYDVEVFDTGKPIGNGAGVRTGPFGDIAYILWSTNLEHPGSLSGNTLLGVGQQLVSSDGKHRAVFQTDGNFVLYNSAGKATWSTGQHAGARFVGMNNTGFAFGVYGSSENNVLWKAPSRNYQTPNSLVMQNDGNLVEYGVTGGYQWSSNTAGK